MELKFSAFVCVFCASLVVSSHSASTTNGKLLQFYPITKQHYRDIIALTKSQPIVSDADIGESHRSLADWSSALQSNWNILLNNYDGIYKNLTSFFTPEETYPVCVMKTQGSLRRRRSSDEHNDSDEYAGLAPNVLLSSSYYGTPQRHGRQHGEELDDDVDVESNTDSEEGDGRYIQIQDSGNAGVQVPPQYTEYNGGYQEYTPNINCIVVIKRKPSSPPNSYPPYPPYPFPPYPYPPPPGYPHQMPPHIPYPPYPYPPYPYPPHPYPHNHHPSHDGDSSRSNERSPLDPVAVAQYQKMIAKYYRHLSALYNADAGTDLKSSELYENHNNDYRNTRKGSKKKRVQRREES